jgi:hypothetical protein
MNFADGTLERSENPSFQEGDHQMDVSKRLLARLGDPDDMVEAGFLQSETPRPPIP